MLKKSLLYLKKAKIPFLLNQREAIRSVSWGAVVTLDKEGHINCGKGPWRALLFYALIDYKKFLSTKYLGHVRVEMKF